MSIGIQRSVDMAKEAVEKIVNECANAGSEADMSLVMLAAMIAAHLHQTQGFEFASTAVLAMHDKLEELENQNATE